MNFETVMSLDYETQHFGFHPRIFLDRVYNAFFENLSAALEELKKHFCTEYSHIIPADSISSKTDELFQDLLKKLDKAIDKLELYIDTNIFKIPNHVILPEDQIHLTDPSTKEEDEKLDKEMEQLKQRIIEERVRRIILKSKIEEQKYIKETMVAYLAKLNGIKTLLSRVVETQEDLYLNLQKCWESLNTMKHPLQI